MRGAVPFAVLVPGGQSGTFGYTLVRLMVQCLGTGFLCWVLNGTGSLWTQSGTRITWMCLKVSTQYPIWNTDYFCSQ